MKWNTEALHVASVEPYPVGFTHTKTADRFISGERRSSRLGGDQWSAPLRCQEFAIGARGGGDPRPKGLLGSDGRPLGKIEFRVA